jgi:hypothetical protein
MYIYISRLVITKECMKKKVLSRKLCVKVSVSLDSESKILK